MLREHFAFSGSGDFAIRTVELSSGERISTRLRINESTFRRMDPQSAFDYWFLRRKRQTPVQHKTSKVHFAELYAGCGGLSLGAAEACRAIGMGFQCAVAVDVNPACLEVYRRNLGVSKAYSNDVREILDGEIGGKPTSKERTFLKYAKKTRFLLSGPPCEGNSDLNNYTRRKDPRNLLYERVGRFAELVRPEHVLVENVPNVVHGKEGVLHTTIQVLRELGYIVDSGVVDLSLLGVPQTRKRHVTVASLTKTLSVGDMIQKYAIGQPRSVWWGFDDLEDEEPRNPYSEPSKQTRENLKRMKYLHDNNVFDLPNRLRPKCHRNGKHSYTSMYGRLRKDQPAQTITSGFGSPGQGRFIHPTRMRTLTPHEAARLQFFPDFFDFSVVQDRTALAGMIGSAAPMKLSYVFCLELLA